MLVLKFLYKAIKLPVHTCARMVNTYNTLTYITLFRMFLFTEKKFLESLKHDVDYSLFLPEAEIQFLKQKQRLHQIQSRVKLIKQYQI